MSKNKKGKPNKNNKGKIAFSDYPNFRPNLTPREILKLGSFGGTYWRPIHSKVTNKDYKNVHKKYDKWWKGIPDDHMTLDWKDYDKDVNKYGVKVGQTLEKWEKKGWITKYNPYGWYHWYCDFYNGRRTPDDERQIGRWEGIAGPNGRFRKWLISLILKKKGGKYDDETISPKIRQTLQHWGYVLTKKDFEEEKKDRKNKKGGSSPMQKLYYQNKDDYLRLRAIIDDEY